MLRQTRPPWCPVQPGRAQLWPGHGRAAPRPHRRTARSQTQFTRVMAQDGKNLATDNAPPIPPPLVMLTVRRQQPLMLGFGFCFWFEMPLSPHFFALWARPLPASASIDCNAKIPSSVRGLMRGRDGIRVKCRSDTLYNSKQAKYQSNAL